MYGEPKQAPSDEQTVNIISVGFDIGSALSTTKCLTLNCYSETLEEAKLQTALNACGDDLTRVVLFSQMGASMSKRGGFMGLLGSGPGASEELARQACHERGIELSIVRAGALKGGGPGNSDEDYVELGLNKAYYNTVFELQQAMVYIWSRRCCGRCETVQCFATNNESGFI